MVTGSITLCRRNSKLIKTSPSNVIVVVCRLIRYPCKQRHGRKSDSSLSCSSAPRKVTRRSSTSDERDRFTFKTHCVYCGWKCDLQKDPKHPSRWRPAYMFCELNAKESVFALRDRRHDELAVSVRDRVQRALFDFPAEEARYYVDCKQRFECSRPLSDTADVCERKIRFGCCV